MDMIISKYLVNNPLSYQYTRQYLLRDTLKQNMRKRERIENREIGNRWIMFKIDCFMTKETHNDGLSNILVLVDKITKLL